MGSSSSRLRQGYSEPSVLTDPSTLTCTATLPANGSASCTIINTVIPTVLPASITPAPGAVGGFVDLTTNGSGGGATMLLVGLLFAVAAMGAAVFGFRRASSG
jgi:hypothetical protein